MREVFQRHLQPLNGKDYQIQECRILYAHHHQKGPNLRCTLQYTLHLAELATGYEWSQLVGCVMHTGVIHKWGKLQQIWEQLRRTELGREIQREIQIWEQLRRSELGREIPDASPTFAPFSYVPDLGMLVQVFPYDYRLPALPLFVAGPPPELEPQLLAQFGLGDWKVEAWDIEPVQWLVEKRAILRITMRARDAATGRVQEKRSYAKVYGEETENPFYANVYGEETGEQTCQVLRTLWDKANAGGVDFAVGKPIAYVSDLRTLVQEEVSGISLKDVFHQKKEVIHEVIPVMRKVARALASLHLAEVAPPLRHRPQDELLFLKKRLEQNCPHLKPKVEEIVGAVAAVLEEEAPSAPTHGDFKLDHILIDGDRLALIDFDDFAEADPLLDVTRMLVVIGRSVSPRLPVSHEGAWAVQQAFVEEYFAHVPAAWRARLPFHYAKAILKIANIAVRRQRPGWAEEVEVLVEEARASLAGRIW